MKRAIVTGANGFIGSQLVSRLLSEGVEIVGIDMRNTPPSLLPRHHTITI